MPESRFTLPPQYDPHAVERPLYRRWLERGVFTARADSPKSPYVIVIPPPNVTAAPPNGPGAEQRDAGHADRVRADEGPGSVVAPGHRPRRHRHAKRGGAPHRERGEDPLRPRPRGVRRAGLGVRARDRPDDSRAAQDDR